MRKRSALCYKFKAYWLDYLTPDIPEIRDAQRESSVRKSLRRKLAKSTEFSIRKPLGGLYVGHLDGNPTHAAYRRLRETIQNTYRLAVSSY